MTSKNVIKKKRLFFDDIKYFALKMFIGSVLTGKTQTQFTKKTWLPGVIGLVRL